MLSFTLSPLKPEDATAIFEHLQSKDISIHTANIPHPYSMRDADDFLKRNAEWEAEHGVARNYAIRNEDGSLIGVIGIHFNHGIDAPRSEFGYWLAQPYWGRGIMTRVIDEFCKLVRERFKVVELEATVHVGNDASVKALLKNGFEQHEALVKCRRHTGEEVDAHYLTRRL